MEIKPHTPFEFKVEGVSVTRKTNNHPTVKCEHQIDTAYILTNALVDLQNGKITLTSNPIEPSKDVWFLIECYNMHKARFQIVSDGTRYLPYDSEKGRIDSNLSPKPSVNLARLSTIDQQIIETAIAKYIFP